MSEAKPYSMFTAKERWNLYCKTAVATVINERIKKLTEEDWIEALSQCPEYEEWSEDLRRFSSLKAHQRLDYPWDQLYIFWDWLENELPEFQSNHLSKYSE